MTTAAPPRPDVDTTPVDDLERLLDAALPCQAEEARVEGEKISDRCPNEATWRVVAPCCGAHVDFCDPHVETFRAAIGVEWCAQCHWPTRLDYRRL